MKEVLIYQRGMTDEQFFNAANRDHCSDPYITLRSRMAESGYALRCLKNEPVDGAEWLLFFDATSVGVPSLPRRTAEYALRHSNSWRARDVYQECMHAGMHSRMALFLWEGPVVLAANWFPELHEKFSLIFTWHDDFAARERFCKIQWPQPARFPSIEKRPFSEKKLLVNISMNKGSRHSLELYSARRAAIRHFERTRPQDFDLFGVGWNERVSITKGLSGIRRRQYLSYRGTVPHKWDVFPNYRFALCYENNKGAPGYITEKIFDCMRSDCVPVYLGAPNIGQYIPPETFIDRREFASDAELERYLVSMPEDRYEAYRGAIDQFLASDLFAPFLEETFAATVMSALGMK